ncbi:MAG: hypothetical protein ACT4PV_01955 [Planctomycetaceae bacterium]
MEYRLPKRAAACMACAAPFAEGAVIVSAISQEVETFQRRDLCEPCYGEGGGVYSAWRSRQPRNEEERIRLDLDLAGEFLRRLVREADPARAPLLYFLTLLLARKRRVKIEGTSREGGTERLRVLVRGEEEDEMLEVAVPVLDETETAAVQTQLAALFDGAAPAPGAPAA